MTVLDDMREAVEETTAAAATFHVHEDRVAALERRAHLIVGRDGWPLAGQQRALLGVAAQHHADCAQPYCRTCETLRHALAVTLAQLRVLIEAGETLQARRTV